MKKLVFTVFCMLFAMVSYAQDATGNEVLSTDSPKQNYELDLRFIKDGFGISANSSWLGFLDFGIYFDHYKDVKNDYFEIENNRDWGFFTGGKYKYWPMEFLYIEGQVGLGWHWSSASYKYNGGWETQKSNSIFCYITPRVGVKVITIKKYDVFLTAGYRWDAMKFKFNKENMNDFFTLGFSVNY